MDQPTSQIPPRGMMHAARLGEELPVFCEKCGYSLHGLPQNVCDHCAIRQFRCPECGHHQPINTLRPAFQQMLGRWRAAWLVGLVIFKLAFFGFTLMGWFAMGTEWTYTYRYTYPTTVQPGTAVQPTYHITLRGLDWETLLAFGIFAVCFAAFGRMFLLRWRHGWLVGLALAALVCAAIVAGAEVASRASWRAEQMPNPYGWGLWSILVYTACVILVTAAVAWGIWVVLVWAFLPRRIGEILLNWQRSQSMQVSALAREDHPRRDP